MSRINKDGKVRRNERGALKWVYLEGKLFALENKGALKGIELMPSGDVVRLLCGDRDVAQKINNALSAYGMRKKEDKKKLLQAFARGVVEETSLIHGAPDHTTPWGD